MHGPSHNQDSLEEALKTLTYRAELNNTDIGNIDIEVTDQSLVFAAPLYEDEVPAGCVGVTTQHRSPGSSRIDTVYDEELTRELYNAVINRVKWYTRAYVTPSERDHILFFFETTCRYNVHSQEARIPGVIRGPDAVQGHLPDGMDPIVAEDTYLVPVHQLPDRYWERSEKCADCTIPIHGMQTRPWIPRDNPVEAYTCPVCGTDTDGVSRTVGETWFLHDDTTGGEPRQNRCGPVGKEERYAFMDWLLDVEPGATLETPAGFPDAPTTLSDGTVIDWLSPLEPAVDPDGNYLPGIRPFVTVTPSGYDVPFIIYKSDVEHLNNAIKQQADADIITEETTGL